ncbi:MAG: hypothetical protein GKS05_08280 [Nitrospirales bacterium]|nr:hypothetical protein [Nitrospirales bacterium]
MMKIFVDCVDSSEFATPGLPVYFQRCLNCGERLDEQILVNRQERGTTKVRSGWPAKKVSLL